MLVYHGGVQVYELRHTSSVDITWHVDRVLAVRRLVERHAGDDAGGVLEKKVRLYAADGAVSYTHLTLPTILRV